MSEAEDIRDIRSLLIDIREMMQAAMEHVVEEALVEEAAELNTSVKGS